MTDHMNQSSVTNDPSVNTHNPALLLRRTPIAKPPAEMPAADCKRHYRLSAATMELNFKSNQQKITNWWNNGDNSDDEVKSDYCLRLFGQ